MRTYASKGFVAIDLDGTALVQKFDKNKLYGFMNSRSDLRLSLVQYCQMAQNAGYDVVIITARPELIERLLLEPGRNKLGTKPTTDIIAEFQKHGVTITQVIRAYPKSLKEGLKGEHMASLLEEYKANGAMDAEGILFDDQLKQIKDVKKTRNQRLIAYDINSYKDRSRFTRKMQNVPLALTETNSELSAKINAIRTKISSISASVYPREKKALNKILNDLMTRLKEAEECSYQPEIDWVKNATDGVHLLVDKLVDPAQKISYEFITQLSKSMLGEANPAHFEPNTKCERTIKHLLVYMTRLQYLTDIKNKCSEYQLYLKSVLLHAGSEETSAIKKAKEKLDVINGLIDVLERTKNPTNALVLFNKVFKANEALLRTSRTGTEFANAICSFLAKIPIVGYLFKTEGGRLADAINYTHSSYTFYRMKHYQKEAEVMQNDSDNKNNP